MAVADFLLTPGMQKVLAAAYGDPERSFTLNELLALAGGGHGSSQGQIERLIAAGVLEEGPRRARQRCIKANTDFFFYPELRSIAMKSFALAEPLRKALEPFRSRINEAFVFGSIAKGTDTHRSDVDLIVVGRVALMKLSTAMLELEKTIGRPIQLNLYTYNEWLQLKRTDAVIAQILNAPRIQIFPHATSD